VDFEAKLALGSDGQGAVPRDFWATYSAFANTHGGVEDSRDLRILPGYGMDDLDLDTLHAYRRRLATFKPDHPWNSPQDPEFLRLAGCWRKDRETGAEGLTLAAILMFGRWTAISEACPLLFLDYQELPGSGADAQTRWLDRIVPDGTWSGNLFDFYGKVAPKLMADLKVPFSLVGDVRQDDTPQHKALREALINTLVHADYSDRASVRIRKSPSGFDFRNPGALRVPAEHALAGGESDCRNRTLHQLFLMLGLGERAGSGLPKIRQAWEPQGYAVKLTESFEPYDQSVLEMLRIADEGCAVWSGEWSIGFHRVHGNVPPRSSGVDSQERENGRTGIGISDRDKKRPSGDLGPVRPSAAGRRAVGVGCRRRDLGWH